MNLNKLAQKVHRANKKWWKHPDTRLPVMRNKGECIALQHSELSECLEGERKGLMDDHLPQYPMAVVEQVDCMIRILDYCAGFYPTINVQKVFDAKMAYNRKRKDHKLEARQKAGGKKF